MELTSRSVSPEAALEKYFGFRSFRPLQRDIITHVMNGGNALVLMPTGGGKSVCYQIPAICMDGLGIVISPLISLMKDQVDGLVANGVKAAFLNSSLDLYDQDKIIRKARTGALDLLYISPEKLVTEQFLNLMQDMQICLFAIDEAHCISQWGHAFRPEYTALKLLRQHFSKIPILALTATADEQTRDDIEEQLLLNEGKRFISSFDRSNLYLEVRAGQQRTKQILRLISEMKNESGIIYCLSRKSTETLAAQLNWNGVKAEAYHAGMENEMRAKVQQNFIHGTSRVICATIAFGMGIDKPDVRFVIHFNLPKNIESYYQEIGRGGRDGLPCRTLLFYSYSDVIQLRRFVENNENEQRKAVESEKLMFMQKFAEARLCRRRILLNYFNEYAGKDCGNCDNCNAPASFIDGTVIAQKALSAVKRLDESVGITMLIDVLRGSRKQEVIQAGYHQIRTYGAGSDLSYFEWLDYIQQLLQLGFLLPDYRKGMQLKLSKESNLVLYKGMKVKLAVHQPFQTAKEVQPLLIETAEDFDENLFQLLRNYRASIAVQRKVPAYIIFTDASLRDMARQKPQNPEQMRGVHGVGEAKLKQFGDDFLRIIKDFDKS